MKFGFKYKREKLYYYAYLFTSVKLFKPFECIIIFSIQIKNKIIMFSILLNNLCVMQYYINEIEKKNIYIHIYPVA